ncbi:MAG TPA: BatA domain-containing protein, partial [Puia sp.]
MLGLLQPIWLCAIAGIVVPVMVHLWNNKQGRVLAIGSIDFLDRTSRRKARSRQISDWWLLVLRCLLLILLALLLAGPSWRRSPGAGVKKGWVLAGKSRMNRASQDMMDSLVRTGFQRHDMEGTSWWEGFRLLDQQAPAGIPFYVFTDGLLEHFPGVRPVSDRPVYWQISNAPEDSIVHWVAAAWKQGTDSMRVIRGSGGASGTSYINQADRRDTTTVDTSTWQVAVYTDDKYARDGQWVTGAVTALGQFTHRNILVRNYKERESIDWLFWLSSKPLPEQIKAAHILFYEPGREIPVDTWIKGSDISVEKVTEQRRPLPPIWTDGFGRPLLALEETKN